MGDRKLSSEQVREIRRRYAGGNTCKVLAMEYGVSMATISNCVAGVKREPADRNERVSFGGDPLPSELNAANAGNGAADKQRGSDKPGGGVPADTPGDTNIKNMSGADEKQGVNGAEKTAGAAEKQRGSDKPGGGDKAVDMAKDSAVPAEYAGDMNIKNMSGADKQDGADKQEASGADKPENSAEKPGGADDKQRGDMKKLRRTTKKTGDDSAKDKAAEEKEGFVFSEKLTRLFDESGKTTGDLALFIEEKTGKGFTTEPIRNWCRGNYYPNIVRIPLIAEFFGVSVEYLLTDTEDKGAKVVESGAEGLDVCDLATGFFMFLEKNIRGDISINILRRDGVVEIKISRNNEELAFKRRVGGSGGAT